jgi:hypothetical protein
LFPIPLPLRHLILGRVHLRIRLDLCHIVNTLFDLVLRLQTPRIIDNGANKKIPGWYVPSIVANSQLISEQYYVADDPTYNDPGFFGPDIQQEELSTAVQLS